ncbi:MAG: MgtC/SapB family protein [Candidatus Omnitrophica bacterium]|nr:MgtC/SapB family protein [Candidatus Omnitrophota bacterium]
MNELTILCRLLLAAIFGGLIGLERELHGRAAGLRTHILVCIGSALLMLISIELARQWQGSAPDPARIAAQVVTGIGFLGAGTIIRERAGIRGLTTAASIWTIAAVGLAIGMGFYFAALVTTAIALVALHFFSRLERRFSKRGDEGE